MDGRGWLALVTDKRLLKNACFNTTVCLVLLCLENLWLLPKQDLARAFFEVVGIALIAYLEHYREREHLINVRKAQGNKRKL